LLKKISVLIKPNAYENKIELSDDTYLVSVQEPPIENRANLALIRLIAEHFHVPKSAVRIVSGYKSRRKIIEIKI
jgi:uncharacterized protein YggU (UPF0235/DUF167 family)